MSLRWWLALLLLGPLLWAQGRYARRRTPRLAPPAEPLQGVTTESMQSFRLLVLGESPAAGIGVATREESLPAQLAIEISRRTGLSVAWRSVAVNGANIHDVIHQQLPQLRHQPADLVVVVIGVNDTTGLTRRRHWRQRILALVTAIRAFTDAPILFASLPRMDSFTALPQPLRTVMGLRARLLDHDLRATIKGQARVACAPALPLLTATQLAADGYHPSAAACVIWAAQLAETAEGMDGWRYPPLDRPPSARAAG
jgi:lysophospholipase L1-like esterase